MQPLSKQNPVAVESTATGRVASRGAARVLVAEVEQASWSWSAQPRWFWREFVRLQQRWDPARHSFYRRLSKGQVSRGELAGYAEEYQLLADALVEISSRAAARSDARLASDLEQHARQQDEQRERWRRFAQAIGWSTELSWCYGADPNQATLDCVKAWLGDPGGSLARDLLTLYAVQRAQSELAGLSLAALARYYGLEDDAGADYFRLQRESAQIQAALARTTLEHSFTGTDPFALLIQAESVYRAYWHVLEAIEEDHHQ